LGLEHEESMTRRVLRRTFTAVAATAAVFTFSVAVLLSANLFQLRAADPLDSDALKQLRTRLAQDPSDEALRREIRALDLLARKAFFTSLSQVRTGALLLGAGAVVMLAALQAAAFLGQRPPHPGK
jgi:hypothetical protein